VLAGDHCKAASDLGIPLVAVGLLYTRGYFDQRVRLDGWQEDSDVDFDPATTPLERLSGPKGEPFLAKVRNDGRVVYIGAWRLTVGRVPMYFLDTDLEKNHAADRELLHKLYAGGPGLRVRQEWILGVGGVRVLRALGIDPVVWHVNEGHAAFMLLERVGELVSRGTSFDQAMARVRSTSVFTTHTPVPAGHDVFEVDQIERSIGPVWNEVNLTKDQFMELGRHPESDGDRFHMTVAAIRLSGRVNGVSARHGAVTRAMWQCLWPDLDADAVPMGHVTNGVHLATWMAQPVMELLDEQLGEDWGWRPDSAGLWERIDAVDDGRLWAAHRELKDRLMGFIDDEARRRWREQWPDAAHLVGAGTLLSPDALTLGFARRFATYKRADLLFRDPERLKRLVTDPWRPVQIVFAGKAHPADEGGKRVLQRVYAYARDPQFEGRIAFLEDYELHLAHRLVQGVDVWVNMPRVPLEACGTSGMKAALNGVPQFGTNDGWWAEGWTGENGWRIPEAPADQEADAWDAEHFYAILEQDVIPLFYERDRHGVPLGWVRRMKHAIQVAGRQFTARRMLQEYATDYYLPAIRSEKPVDVPPTA
jgi:starch phosphorylase